MLCRHWADILVVLSCIRSVLTVLFSTCASGVASMQLQLAEACKKAERFKVDCSVYTVSQKTSQTFSIVT